MNEDPKENKMDEKPNMVAPQTSTTFVPEKVAGEPIMNGKDGGNNAVEPGTGRQQTGDGGVPSSGDVNNPETLKAQAKAAMEENVNEETPKA